MAVTSDQRAALCAAWMRLAGSTATNTTAAMMPIIVMTMMSSISVKARRRRERRMGKEEGIASTVMEEPGANQLWPAAFGCLLALLAFSLLCEALTQQAQGSPGVRG